MTANCPSVRTVEDTCLSAGVGIVHTWCRGWGAFQGRKGDFGNERFCLQFPCSFGVTDCTTRGWHAERLARNCHRSYHQVSFAVWSFSAHLKLLGYTPFPYIWGCDARNHRWERTGGVCPSGPGLHHLVYFLLLSFWPANSTIEFFFTA